eukprot:CAMPEP_0174746816 /NCGR_PEP_ID=MMETSP1094-20130205/89902_1 /TAXON_ID=156173 /ORGANISM="Chrysochromulina brevifilum, Strain UTEX LB 985" /LENGTH=50 /DNA_ID=CAMNT_0015951591 /DNA_START=101 /DNA_END=250 /DNA_ORIENTATION=-
MPFLISLIAVEMYPGSAARWEAANRMPKDVRKALCTVAQEQGGMDEAEAA